MKLVRSKQADQDIEAIADYIAQDSPRSAVKWVDDIEGKFLALAATRGMGKDRSDVFPDFRTYAFGNYLICYRAMTNGVEIVRVFHGARQWEELL